MVVDRGNVQHPSDRSGVAGVSGSTGGALGEAGAAASQLASLVAMLRTGKRLDEVAAEHAERGDACRDAGDAAGALAAYYEALTSSGV